MRFAVVDGMIQDPSSKRIYDMNGWYTVEDNPISKVGVYPYYGRQMNISGVEPNKIYWVLRPESSLSDPEFHESIKLLPWIDEHIMLGLEGIPAEEKGVEGITGEKVYFKDDTVHINLKVFSEDLKQSIDAGKKELSLGYTARYQPQTGIFEGERYDFVQRELRGNHLALVKKGRMGSEVAVLDAQLSLLNDGETMNEKQLAEALAKLRGIGFDEALAIIKSEKGKGQDMGYTLDMDALKGMISDQVKSCMDECADGLKTMVTDMMGSPEFQKGKGQDEANTELEEELASEKEKNTALTTEVEKLRVSVKDQEAGLELEKKNELAGILSDAVGTFDHSAMSLLDVAKYGLEQCKLEAPEGAELVVLETHLHAVKNSGGRFAVEDSDKDTKNQPSAVANYLTPKAE